MIEESVPRKRGDILIVDDEPEIVSLLTDFLTDEGYSVRSAGTAVDAWIEILRQPPAFLIADIVMPGGSGLLLVIQLRAQRYTFPVALMTASTPPDTEYLARYRTTCFLKPFNLPEILDTVARHVLPKRNI
jgi:DNA-binding response OmpR family regulator